MLQTDGEVFSARVCLKNCVQREALFCNQTYTSNYVSDYSDS